MISGSVLVEKFCKISHTSSLIFLLGLRCELARAVGRALISMRSCQAAFVHHGAENCIEGFDSDGSLSAL